MCTKIQQQRGELKGYVILNGEKKERRKYIYTKYLVEYQTSKYLVKGTSSKGDYI